MPAATHAPPRGTAPASADSSYTAALRLLQAGDSTAALAALDALLVLHPTHAPALNDSGVALAQLGRAPEALERFARAAAAAPQYAPAHHNAGLLALQLGQADAACAHFEASLAIEDRNAAWWVDAGNALLAAQRPVEALARYDRALAIDARHAGAASNRGLALRAMQRPSDAEAAFRHAAALDPRAADAWSNLGLLLKEADRIDEAANALARAHALAPGNAVIVANQCAVLLQQGRRDEALTLAERLTRDAPQAAEAWNALAHAQMENARFADGVRSCERALALAPHDATATFNLAMMELMHGDYEPGLAHYEARRRLSNQLVGLRRPPGPEWDGASLNGRTVLVSAEQGAGDMFQFARYAAALHARGAARVVLEAQPALMELLATAPGVDAVVSTAAPWPAFDVHVPLLSLPRLLGTRVNTIPATVPYLRAAPRALAAPVHAASGLRVGFVWSGNPRQNRNRLRSVPVRQLLDALDQPGVALFALQVGAPDDPALRDAVARGRVTDLGATFGSFADTAAALDACDLVVSVCTSTAHLAGALGRPVFTLLARVADWRWFTERSDSPWYPTMRLFRQTDFDDWSAPLAAVAEAIRAAAADVPGWRARFARVHNDELGSPRGDADPMIAAPSKAPTLAAPAAALFERASRAHTVQRYDEALALYDALLAIAPEHAEGLNNSGVLLAQRGDPAAGERRVSAALSARPSYGQAHHNLALLARARGDVDTALASFERAVACEPQQAGWWLDFGNCAAERMRHETALRAFDRALALDPRNPTIIADRAIALRGVFRQDEAIAACRAALQLDPHNAAAHANLGMFLKEVRAWDEAEQAFLAGLAAIQDHPLLLTNLSTLYLEWGRLDDAQATSERLIARHPAHPEGYNGRGCALLERGDLDGARREFAHAQSLEPANGNAEWNLAFLDLLAGDLPRGLRGFERRRSLNGFIVQSRELPGREWTGEPLDGKTIFVHEEQGLGDVLQFVRYAAALKARGAGRVIVETSADAASLIATAPGVDAVVTRGAALPAYDVYVPLMSLPYRCDTRVETIPAAVPYLTAPARPAGALVRAHDGRLKVGIVWGGNPRNQRDKFRSVPLAALLAAVHREDVTIFSLQKGPHAAALARLGQSVGVVDLDPHLHTLDDTAAAIMELDLVITICTSMAHLAGALHRPVWTLLAHVADWRWFRNRDDTPWYPSMRLFRQPAPGDWAQPLGRVAAALAVQAAAR